MRRGIGHTFIVGLSVGLLMLAGEALSPLQLAVAAEGGSAPADSTVKPATRPKKKKRKKKKKPPLFVLRGKIRTEVIYDDNILHFSPDYADDFRSGSYPYKFDIETLDDLIVSGMGELMVRTPLLTPRPMDVRLRYTRWQYTKNGVKNNESWSLRLRAPLTGQNYLEMSYYYAPWTYIRKLSDRDPDAPRSSPLQWRDFEYASNAFRFGYWQKLSKRFEAKLLLGRSMRFYNQPFMENDNWEWNYGGQLVFRLTRKIKLTGEYIYHNVKARAADEIGETPETSDNSDASYERDSYRLQIDYWARRTMGPIKVLTLRGQYAAYFFTTQRLVFDDPYHVGRKDEIYRLHVAFDTYELMGPITAQGGYRYTERMTNSPAEADEVGEEKSYTDNRVWAGLTYTF